ncbi:MAG: hypothetical protein CMB99_01895 [Flavobacteriaceae bacterium]|nr:hypothetical protein [Flavobacteriaceae bacterium]|tara:strand:+ start:28125 stop:29030 length:906 start_codon:yes stop_codon:yes gene_type:complete
MYLVHKFKKEDQTLVEINKSDELYVLINLSEGGRLQSYALNKVDIIKEMDDFPYSKSYASSLLFPFVSRTENGEYTFEGESHQLDRNDPEGINALHGLVYNKTFELVDVDQSNSEIKVQLRYLETNKPKGFPHDYELFVNYTFSKDGMSLEMRVQNISETRFPFTIGWHPYFYMPDRAKNALSFDSDQTVLFDEKLITKEIVDREIPKKILLENQSFDDCFILKGNKASFETPQYSIDFRSSAKENFLQIYTPPNSPIIAIEPMVGLSNSLNNGIGLQVLQPQEAYEIQWTMNIKTFANEF